MSAHNVSDSHDNFSVNRLYCLWILTSEYRPIRGRVARNTDVVMKNGDRLGCTIDQFDLEYGR